MILQKNDGQFLVDLEKTKAYYQSHSLCDCQACRNFYQQASAVFPKLKAFLADFGVDLEKPDEIAWGYLSPEGKIDYLFVACTVRGEILRQDFYETDLQDSLFLSIVIDKGYVPNEQEGEDYFVISVCNIVLPWVLEEPF